MNISKLSIGISTPIKSALKIMDQTGARLLLVMDNNTFISLLSIGDIQRAIISNHSLNESIKNILRKKVNIAFKDDNYEVIRERMLQDRMEFMPVIDEKNKLLDVIFWEDIFKEKERVEDKLDLPVVIMAGGEGSRMRPLTHIIPKALIPIDDKTIVEHIMDNFVSIGCSNFFFSLNYKSEMIRKYLSNLKSDLHMSYFEEKKPLGTAGSLHLLKGRIDKTFFISNCDILIKDDYREIYKYHKKYKNELTIVGAIQDYSIPYGTLETGEEGQLLKIIEKPQLNFLINSGMYILEPHLLDDIPNNEFFHITDLINKISLQKRRVGVFPVSEKSWTDIGEWDKYLKLIR